jgi:thioredoxin:protein disulfide reductase
MVRRSNILLALLLAALATPALAATGLDTVLGKSSGQDEFLPPEVAFKPAATVLSADQVSVHWQIAPGYYLYRDRAKFSTSNTDAVLGQPNFPAGEQHNDEFFGQQVVYHHDLEVKLAVSRASTAAMPLHLTVTYQGCADKGLCYPPQKREFELQLPAATAGGNRSATGTATGAAAGANGSGYVSEQDAKADLIRSGSWLKMLAAFFVSGLLVAFTGCVLPTIPILSGIIVGAGHKVTTLRAFMLSLTYVLGMAFTYTTAGALTAASGLHVQAMFQSSWVVVLFAGLFVLMAASMFGAFTLQMPSFIQTRLAELSNRQRGGHFGGVAVMGALSALIVTACVAPAMVAALAVISQSGSIWRGASALFAMSMGMGMPLLVVGASAGRLLPRAGAWMDDIKRLAGCMMLAVAAWMLARLVGDRLALLLFAIPFIAAFIVLWRFAARGNGKYVARIAGVAAAVYAVLLVTGYTRGATDPLHPLARGGASAEFQPIRSVAELDAAVKAAAATGKSVMLDFYADWCVSCKEMERYTFGDRAVLQQLANTVLLRADVTANSADDQALFKRFGIFGPPTIAFYDATGAEQPAYRVVGFMKAPAFAEVIGKALAAR